MSPLPRLRARACAALAVVLVGALEAALLAGCGDRSPDSPAQETARPLKVQHALDLTLVPGRAKRPVTLGPGELDDALALRARPVGAATPGRSAALPRYLAGRLGGFDPVGPVADADLERIRSLDPDVILGTIPSHARIYRALTEIAPTVIADEAVDWKPNLRQDGEALGRTDAAEALLSAYDRRVARLRARLRRRGRLSARRFRRALPPTVRPFLSRRFVSSILADLGLGGGRAEYAGGSPRSKASRRAAPFDHWSLGEGPLAAGRVLEDIERHLTRAKP